MKKKVSTDLQVILPGSEYELVEFQLFSARIPVKYDINLLEDQMGEWHAEEDVVKVDGTLADNPRQRVTFHEVAEAMADMGLQLRDHDQVELLGNMLQQFCRTAKFRKREA